MSSEEADYSDDDLIQEEEDWEDWEEDESDAVKSLFCEERFPSVHEALDYDAGIYGFDLRKWRLDNSASEYDALKVINYIRSEVAAGRDPRPALSMMPCSETPVPWHDDAYLRPVMENDELLFHDWEEEEEGNNPNYKGNDKDDDTNTGELIPDEMVAILHDMHAMALSEPSLMDLLIASSHTTSSHTTTSHTTTNNCVESTENAAFEHLANEEVKEKIESEDTIAYSQQTDIDRTYFESYSFFDIHRDMLSDRTRTETYQHALEQNPGLLQGATVLDVGCGTGVLSMFAARGGAARVVAVDGSPEIASVARKIVEKNGFNDRVMVISSKIEDLKELPGADSSCDTRVDVLVSEWMGYALLFESMLDSVLVARDRFLKPGGAILPDIANIYVAAGDPGASGLDFWSDVYGLDMTIISDSLRSSALKEAIVRVVDSQTLVTEAQKLITLDLASMRAKDQDFSSEFYLKASAGPRTVASLVIWFDTVFSERFCKESPQILPTGPYEERPTHWAQTVLVLPDPVVISASPDDGNPVAIKGRLSMARRVGRHRTLDISVEYAPVMADGRTVVEETKVQLYSMGVGGGVSSE